MLGTPSYIVLLTRRHNNFAQSTRCTPILPALVLRARELQHASEDVSDEADEGPFWRSVSWKNDFGYQAALGEHDTW
jgi:hypothetical protein